MTNAPVVIQGLNYAYGEGALRRQVLFEIDAEIHPGEILILTGPSGSGKTTLLTLIGALRSVQEGSLKVLGQELRGAGESLLAGVRQRIGYIFQAHNLLDALTAQQNVQVTLQLHPEFSAEAARRRAADVLDEVGLGDRLGAHPSELSGGERQRVAIARALAVKPELVLADEPTASLDRATGRSVIELLHQLAKKQGVTVVLVTHDNRILDIADRILGLEDGRLTSLMRSIASESQHMLRLLSQDLRKGHLVSRVAGMTPGEFETCLEELTDETRGLLEIADLVQGKAFEDVENQVVCAVGQKLRSTFQVEEAALYFIDPDDGSLRTCTSAPVGSSELRSKEVDDIPMQVFRIGEPLSTTDVDGRSVLAAPSRDSDDQVFGVIELRAHDGRSFDATDRRELENIAATLGALLEVWWRMGCGCRRASIGTQMACCPPNL
jgi:putative ABC transport system ATP-binding protein